MNNSYYPRASLLTAALWIVPVSMAAMNASAAAMDERSKSVVMRPDLKVEHGTRPSSEAKELAPEKARKLREISEKVFGIKWNGRVLAATDRGFEIMTDQVMTLSYRPTGNAYFVQNLKASLSQPGFDGPDETYIRRGKEILSRLGIEASEISGAKLLQQFIQAGYSDPNGKGSHLEPVKKDRRTLLVTRSIRGIPVWNSRLIMDLDREGQIASLEISWPQISSSVLENAAGLQKSARANFKPPQQKFAKPEAVEAGILHSPAASFLDEQVAAIRVIYRSDDARIGKKAVAYLDAAGRAVAMPRTMDIRDTPAPERGPNPQIKPPR